MKEVLVAIFLLVNISLVFSLTSVPICPTCTTTGVSCCDSFSDLCCDDVSELCCFDSSDGYTCEDVDASCGSCGGCSLGSTCCDSSISLCCDDVTETCCGDKCCDDSTEICCFDLTDGYSCDIPNCGSCGGCPLGTTCCDSMTSLCCDDTSETCCGDDCCEDSTEYCNFGSDGYSCIAYPPCNDLTTTCTCDDYYSGSISYDYANNCLIPDGPQKKFTAPSRFLDDDGYSTYYGAFAAPTTIEFSNLYYNTVYEFSICPRGGWSGIEPGFDAVLVLRDDEGNVITANDDCSLTNTVMKYSCAYVSFTYKGVLSNSVFLSIYLKRISEKTNEVVCAGTTSPHHVALYAAAVSNEDGATDISCSPKLVCKNTPVTGVAKKLFNPSAYYDTSKSDLCGTYVLYYIGDDYTGYYYCDMIGGQYLVRTELFGGLYSCESQLTVVGPTTIAIACAWPLQQTFFSDLVSSNCPFSKEYCVLDPMDYVPNIYFGSDYCPQNKENFKVEPLDSDCRIGTYINYYITEELSGASVTCQNNFYGIQPTQLIRDETNEEYFDNAVLYFDTVYTLYYQATYPYQVTSYYKDFDFIARNGANYEHFPFYTIEGCNFGGGFLNCLSSVTFCVPSQEYLGDYTNYFEDSLELMITGDAFYNSSPTNQGFNPVKITQQNNVKRAPTQQIKSIGNPRVRFTYATDPTLTDGSCIESGYNWDYYPIEL